MTSFLTTLFMVGAMALNPTFEKGNLAYSDGNYAAAVSAYEELVARHVVDPAVFYNLGNAYYRLGRLGPAIANYERALQLDPGMENARQNLNQCLSQTKRALKKPFGPSWEQSLLFWHNDLPPGAARALLVVLSVLFWALLALRQWRPVKYSGVVAVILALLALGCGFSAWVKAHPMPIAVASVEKVPVRFGTSDTDTVHFELYDGDRVAVEAKKGDWVRVRTIDGDRGWAQASDFTFVGPPYLPEGKPSVGKKAGHA